MFDQIRRALNFAYSDQVINVLRLKPRMYSEEIVTNQITLEKLFEKMSILLGLSSYRAAL